MVRTSGGIRISAGKSSKKGGGSSSGGTSRPAPSTPGTSSSKGGSRLPPIPHTETPSWQKPITNFFNLDNGSAKNHGRSDETVTKEKVSEMEMEQSHDVNTIDSAAGNGKEDGQTGNKHQIDVENNGNEEDSDKENNENAEKKQME